MAAAKVANKSPKSARFSRHTCSIRDRSPTGFPGHTPSTNDVAQATAPSLNRGYSPESCTYKAEAAGFAAILNSAASICSALSPESAMAASRRSG